MIVENKSMKKIIIFGLFLTIFTLMAWIKTYYEGFYPQYKFLSLNLTFISLFLIYTFFNLLKYKDETVVKVNIKKLIKNYSIVSIILAITYIVLYASFGCASDMCGLGLIILIIFLVPIIIAYIIFSVLFTRCQLVRENTTYIMFLTLAIFFIAAYSGISGYNIREIWLFTIILSFSSPIIATIIILFKSKVSKQTFIGFVMGFASGFIIPILFILNAILMRNPNVLSSVFDDSGIYFLFGSLLFGLPLSIVGTIVGWLYSKVKI